MRLGLTSSVVVFLACAEAAVAQPGPAPMRTPSLYYASPAAPGVPVPALGPPPFRGQESGGRNQGAGVRGQGSGLVAPATAVQNAPQPPELLPLPPKLEQPERPPAAVPFLPMMDAAGGATAAADAFAVRYGTTHEANAYPYLGWARVEGLLWWVKDGPAPPPLVTTGPTNNQAGVLGQPGTTVLFGGTDLDYGDFGGARWTIGWWCDPYQKCGFEVSGFVLERRSALFGSNSDATGAPVVARPFIDAQTGQERSLFATFPDRFAGGVAVSASDQLWGIEANFLDNAWHGGVPLGAGRFPYGEWRAGCLAGFRFLDLRESLQIGQVSDLLPGGQASFLGTPVFAPNVLALNDAFNARNQFYGGQVGGRVEWVHGCLFVDACCKLALGVRHEVVVVNGTTLLAPVAILNTCPPAAVLGCPTVAGGGFLATSTNIGARGRTGFGVVPEVGLTVGYQCCQYLRVFAGYTFLYWDRVVRSSNQIDRTVNLTQVPVGEHFGTLVGPARPAPLFQESDFWAQGISLGFEVHF